VRGFNLSTYYYTDKRIKYVLCPLLTLLIVIFTFYNYRAYSSQQGKLQVLIADVAGVRKEVGALRQKVNKFKKGRGVRADKGAEDIAGRIKWINAVLERKNFSWSEMFYSLEKVMPKGVSITKINPDYEGKKIRISGAAKGFDNVAALVDNLDASDYVKKSFLLSENAILIDNKFPAISFEVEAEGKF